jgi:hypothetical protein
MWRGSLRHCYKSVTRVVLLALAVLKCVTRMVLLALVVLQICHADGVAGPGSVTNVSHGWCC